MGDLASKKRNLYDLFVMKETLPLPSGGIQLDRGIL